MHPFLQIIAILSMWHRYRLLCYFYHCYVTAPRINNITDFLRAIESSVSVLCVSP